MIIDTVNIQQIYSATLLEDSLNSVLEYPSLKKPLSNDWAEYDGLEVDLLSPVLDKKEVVLSFLIEREKIDLFVSFLMAKTYRAYGFSEINTTLSLRFVEVTGIEKSLNKCSITVKLSDDFPLQNYTFTNPFLTAENRNYFLDGKNVAEYGLIVLNDSEFNLLSEVVTKDKLEIESKFIGGSLYSEQVSKKKETNATISFFANQTLSNFLIGYRAFLYNLVKPNMRVIVINGLSYNFYYDKSNIDAFILKNGNVWCSFQVKIILI